MTSHPQPAAPAPRKLWPFAGPSVLAPMEGVTHPTFRDMLVAQGGLHLVCTEFVRITHHPVSRARLETEVHKSGNCPLSVQVMGNNAAQMANAARIVAGAGADAVDINLGCPMPRVVRKGVGAAMLKNPEVLREVLLQMREATPGLLSAKIRAGFDDADHTLQIAELVQACGVDYIAVHPRRRCDFYAGVADWRIIRTLKQALSIPVVGNGDVWYAKDALRMQEQTGCDAVMIGRPALRNPWIFQQIEELRRGAQVTAPDGPALVSRLHHIKRRYAQIPRRRADNALGPFKEIVRWMARAIDDGGAFAKAALRLQSVDAILTLAERELMQLTPQQLDLQADGHLGLEQPGNANSASPVQSHNLSSPQPAAAPNGQSALQS